MKTNNTGFVVVANVVLSGAIALGGVGAVVSFYHANDLLNHIDIPTEMSPQPSPTPLSDFMPVVIEQSVSPSNE